MASLADELDGAASILVKAPSMNGDRDLCTTLLTDGVASPSVLFVSYTRGMEACVDQLGDAGADARNVGVITVGDASASVDREGIETRTVSTPSDLTGLGIEIGEIVEAWPTPVTVCFDSLTAMLQYVAFETAYEFLHTLTGQFDAADARAHFHIDPAAHDAATVAALTSLVDAAVALEDEPVVRTRDFPP